MLIVGAHHHNLSAVADHHIITSSHHHIISPHHHITTSPHHHIITTSPHHHIITSSHHHIITSSHHHIITSSHHHITAPNPLKGSCNLVQLCSAFTFKQIIKELALHGCESSNLQIFKFSNSQIITSSHHYFSTIKYPPVFGAPLNSIFCACLNCRNQRSIVFSETLSTEA